MSGLGKGITISSIGRILKSSGVNVTTIKIDPYLNSDSGTMSPFEHGETFVLDDGGECDLDLGNYERFLDIQLSARHNITTGKVYQDVIHAERRGDYLGKTVQIVPHATDLIMDWIQKVSKIPVDGTKSEPEVCLIEVGGTVGDIESMVFLEALRQFQFKVGKENIMYVHVSLVPTVGSEQKTKPTQHSVKELRSLGLSPDVIVCRSDVILEEATRNKLGVFCQVDPENTISVHNVSNIYHVPLILVEQNLHKIIKKTLSLVSMTDEPDFCAWNAMACGVDDVKETIDIAIVGKYLNTGNSDAYLSVLKALIHGGIHLEVKVQIKWVDASDLEEPEEAAEDSKKSEKYTAAWELLSSVAGILCPGGFGTRGVEGKIAAAKYARENKIPYLGICLGMQVMVIDYSRHILLKKSANSEEFNKDSPDKVIVFMPEIDPTTMGGTMRLGARTTIITNLPSGELSLASRVYGVEHPGDQVTENGSNIVIERHRHRYEVNPAVVNEMTSAGLHFTGRDDTGERMEICELKQIDHPFFFGVQFHPEFKSRPNRPSPPFFAFISAALEENSKKGGIQKKEGEGVRKRELSKAGKIFQDHEQAQSPHKRVRKSLSSSSLV